MVDEITYNADSASWTSDIDGLQAFSASLNTNFVTSTELSASSSTLQNNINTKLSTSSFNAYTASQSPSATGSLLITASAVGNVITFTKGDSSTFPVTVATGSTVGFVTTSSFNTYTASASTNVSASINAATSSLSASITTTINGISSKTGSYITSAQTSSMTVLSSSFAITSSFLLGSVASASFATSASFAQTASFLLGNVVSSSFAQTASIARNVVVTATNGNASTLPIGTVVRITGANGDNPVFNSASWDNDSSSANALGILQSSVVSGATGSIVVTGVVVGVDTQGMAAGNILYLSASGQFTNVQPQAPLHIVTLGEVLRVQQNNGSIFVNISNGWELNELHNVRIVTPAQGDILAYNSASQLWENSSSLELGLATTGSNTFRANQIISGNLDIAGNISAVSASFLYVKTVYETASVIFSSGSNQLGDELSDTQTLSGSVKVQGTLTVNGTAVITSSFDASGYLLTSSFNTYTASAATNVSGAINTATSSL
jgi:hypothetical protein